jgi:hypothetical protein
MAEIIERSNNSYEQRDKARMEVLAIEQTNKKEQETFDAQMEEMGRILEEEIKAAAERRKNQQQNELSNAEEEHAKMVAEQEASIQALLKEKEAAAKGRGSIIQNYEDALNQIKSETGVSDVEELIKILTDTEEHNYSLFKFSNEQRNMIEDLKEEINSLKNEQSDFVISDSIQNFDDTLQDLERSITMNKIRRKSLDSKIKDSENNFDAIKDGVKMLVMRLDCFREGESSNLSINDTNLLQYMGLIEDKATQILNQYQHLGKAQIVTTYEPEKLNVEDDEEHGCKLNDNGNSKQGSTKNSCPDPPDLVEYSSDEERSDTETGISRPMTVTELKERTLSRMSQSQKRIAEPAPFVENGRRSTLTRRKSSIMASGISSSIR